MEKPWTAEDLLVLNRWATIARLLSGVAHDVNNALQVIGGSVELLQDLDLPEAAVTRLGRIRTQHTRAAVVIQNLLAFAREEPDVIGALNLRELISRAVSLRAFAIGRAGLRIAVNAPQVDSCGSRGNRMLLQQAVLNLITNAEQALKGTVDGAITVELCQEGGWVTVRVCDNGPGVPDDLRERVFEPFFTTKSSREASGLGLAVARGIAEQSGGTLSIERPALGASFALRLPLAR